MKFVSTEQAIKNLQEGKMLVMVNAEDRENEGDLILPAQFSTRGKVNFMTKEARGVVCAAFAEELAGKFELLLMVPKNTSNHEAAFIITVDAKDATAGVSAYERDMTIKISADDNAKASDFVRPGHMNPLIVKKGGVLEHIGRTEGTVDLYHLTGLKQACVTCEIVKDDGGIARRNDLEEFCTKHNLNMIAVSDIVGYRLKNESLIKLQEKSDAILTSLRAQKFILTDHNNAQHIAFAFKEIRKCKNVESHISGSGFELLTSDKFSKLLDQIRFLSENGGVIVFMQGEKSSVTQLKDYGIGAQILRYFSIGEVKLMS